MQGVVANLGAFSPSVAEPSHEGFIADIWATIVDLGPSSNKVTFVIPPKWYLTGRLSVAFPTLVGIDDLSLIATCAPTGTVSTYDISCPCECSKSGEVLPQVPDWTYPGLPAYSLDSTASPAFYDQTPGAYRTLPCLGLAEDSAKPKIALPCDDPDLLYYLVQDGINLTALKLKDSAWQYLGGERFITYDYQTGRTGRVEVSSGTGTQDFDLQTRRGEVCMVWHDISSHPLVYCYNNQEGRWIEVGAPRRISPMIGGDVELLMPECECSHLSNYYFVIVGGPEAATVWFYNKETPRTGWRLLGGESGAFMVVSGQSVDAHIAMTGAGSFKCLPHAVVGSNGNLAFARFELGASSSDDPLGFTAGQWLHLGSVVRPSEAAPGGAEVSVNDFLFTESGIPAVGWVDSGNSNFAYLSAWKEYPNSGTGNFEVAAKDTGRFGSIPPVFGGGVNDAPAYTDARGMSLASFGDVVFVAITDSGVGGAQQVGRKVYISYLNLKAKPQLKDCWWSEYETEAADLLPQDQDHSLCSDGLSTSTFSDAHNQIKISCNGNIYLAHVIAKDTHPLNIASLAKNGLPNLALIEQDVRREEAAGEEFSPATERGIATEDGAFYCSAKDFPCVGDSINMVYVCHYSSRSGYQTFCVPESDSETLRFFPNDYCGPCVAGFGGANLE